MATKKPGDRVGAVLSAKDGVVNFLGYGVYAGDEIPDEKAVGFFAETLRLLGSTNPKIILDNGDVVWGCECWWGSEATVRSMLEGKEADKEVVIVAIADMRAKVLEAEKKLIEAGK